MPNTNDKPASNPKVGDLYMSIARLTGGCPEAIQERHIALELFEAIGEVYYDRWLETGEILPEALEDCIEAKQHRDAAERFDAEFKQKQEAKLEREGT